ncbi:MAG: SLC13 family permease, partial [Fusobacteriaceae bacterium]
SLLILILNVYFVYGKKLKVSAELKARIMDLDASRSLKDVKLLKEAGTIFLLVIIGFVLNNFIDKGLAMISLTGAISLVIIAKRKPAETLHHVEWDTLFFFIGLFMMVRGIQETHVIDHLGSQIISLTKGHFNIAVLGISWISALFTSIIGNVANAATTSKIIQVMIPSFQGQGDVNSFWWALSFGSCLGGNISILGSATNVVAVSAAAKAGTKITFVEFLKFGALIAIQTIILSNIYIYFRYL